MADGPSAILEGKIGLCPMVPHVEGVTFGEKKTLGVRDAFYCAYLRRDSILLHKELQHTMLQPRYYEAREIIVKKVVKNRDFERFLRKNLRFYPKKYLENHRKVGSPTIFE